MKYINQLLLSKLPSFKYLIQKDLEMRKDNVTVHKIPGYRAMKESERNAPRAWKLLPNIQSFEITLRPYDWLFLLFNLKKRNQPKLEFTVWKNGNMNHYLMYMFKRLRKQVSLGLYKEASKTIWILMNSSSYQTTSYNHVMKNWHRKELWWKVQRHIKSLRKLCKNRETNLDFSRIYIPKSNNQLRPLGVPTIPWRVYLHMYNNCLTEWRMITESGYQHGYLPKKGILTAWDKLIKLIDSENIYESDFRKFFDSIDPQELQKELVEIGLPENEVEFIGKLNGNSPKVEKRENVIQEYMAKQLEYITKEILNENSDMRYRIWHEWGREEDLQGVGDIDLLKPLENEKFKESLREGGEEYWNLMQENNAKVTKYAGEPRGVPQGAPTSCSLATLLLRPLERKLPTLGDAVIYADDIIYFPNNPEEDPAKILENTKAGININLKKSGWIKRKGIWQVESFKFLGYRYYPKKEIRWNPEYWKGTLPISLILDIFINGGIPIFTVIVTTMEYFRIKHLGQERFVAETRKGSKLEFTRKEAFLAYLEVERDKQLDYKERWRKSLNAWLRSREYWFDKEKHPIRWMFSKGVSTGYFSARLQNGSWEMSTEQNFEMTHIPGSWIWKRLPIYCWKEELHVRDVKIFNASSLAVNDLANWIRGKDISKGTIVV